MSFAGRLFLILEDEPIVGIALEDMIEDAEAGPSMPSGLNRLST
jgi:hypothetical protein